VVPKGLNPKGLEVEAEVVVPKGEVVPQGAVVPKGMVPKGKRKRKGKGKGRKVPKG
jgi:hypothetical protein